MLPISKADHCEVVLNEHEADENAPTFLFECLNGHQQRECIKVKMALDSGDDLASMDAVFATVEKHLIGWANVGIEFSKGQLGEVINYMQCIELLGALVLQMPGVADKKKYKLPLQSSTENSAKSAED